LAATSRSTSAVALLGLLVASPAFADKLEVLGPTGFVSPDGFEVAVRRIDGAGTSSPVPDAKLNVEGGDTSKGPLGFNVIPRAGSRLIKLKAEAQGLSAEAQYEVGPPAARISLQLIGNAPVKNRDAAVELSVEVLGSDGKPDPQSAPPVVRANVGSIEALTRVADGRYHARYVLPTTLYPEVAVVVAFSAWPHPQSVHGAFGAVRVPLASAVELPGQTERDADFSIVIAGQKFGPVKAGPDGRFKVPVVVPPGYGTGQGTAIDRLGNRRVTSFDLQLPPTDQLACVISPTRLPADGASRARVMCATSDPYGNVATAAKVLLAAGRGSLSPPRPLENGVVEWTYVAPRELSEKPDVLAASWHQGNVNAREELQLQLVQGPAVQAKIAIDETLVHLGGRALLQLEVGDSLGRPRPGAHVTVDAPVGKPGPVEESAPGKLKLDWLAPESGSPQALKLAVRAWGPAGAEPAKLVAWGEGDGLYAAVTDLAGLPVPAQSLKVGAATLTTNSEGVARIGQLLNCDLEVRHADWPGLSTTVHVRDNGRWVFPAGARPGSAPRVIDLQTAPAIPVNVRVQAKGPEVTYWVESPRGEVLKGRPLSVTASGGALGAASEVDGRTRVVVTGLKGAETVSVVDLQTQVIGLAEVRP
jgi:hypothetical protein